MRFMCQVTYAKKHLIFSYRPYDSKFCFFEFSNYLAGQKIVKISILKMMRALA